MKTKKHLSDQQRKALIKRLVASAEPKKLSLRPPSDHWQQTPRENGRFSSDRPTSKKGINFKIPVDLMEELERLAIARDTSIHLVCKDFIIRNFDEMVRQCQEESRE